MSEDTEAPVGFRIGVGVVGVVFLLLAAAALGLPAVTAVSYSLSTALGGVVLLLLAGGSFYAALVEPDRFYGGSRVEPTDAEQRQRAIENDPEYEE